MDINFKVLKSYRSNATFSIVNATTGETIDSKIYYSDNQHGFSCDDNMEAIREEIYGMMAGMGYQYSDFSLNEAFKSLEIWVDMVSN